MIEGLPKTTQEPVLDLLKEVVPQIQDTTQEQTTTPEEEVVSEETDYTDLLKPATPPVIGRVVDSNEASRIALRRSELSNISFAEAIFATHNSVAAEVLQGDQPSTTYDPTFKLDPAQVAESGLPVFVIQKGIEDGVINSQDGWDNFVEKAQKSRQYQEVLADYHGGSKFVGGLIPALVDPYNAADIAITAGLAALPVGGWGAIIAKTALAGVTGGAAGYFSESAIQAANASYDNEALELSTWLGVGLGTLTYGVGTALKSSRTYSDGGIPPKEGDVFTDATTGQNRSLKMVWQYLQIKYLNMM